MAKPLNVAAPLASVVAVALLSVAPAGPEAITAVTGTPAPPAGLPAPSRTWSTGCGVNAAPLVAVGEGWVVIVSWVAVPAVGVVEEVVGGVGPVAEQRSVVLGADPLIDSPLNVDAPIGSIVGGAFIYGAP